MVDENESDESNVSKCARDADKVDEYEWRVDATRINNSEVII